MVEKSYTYRDARHERNRSLSLSSRNKKIAEQSQLTLMRDTFTPGIPDLKQLPFELWQRYVESCTLPGR